MPADIEATAAGFEGSNSVIEAIDYPAFRFGGSRSADRRDARSGVATGPLFVKGRIK
jgi:hypothetical protein